MDNVIQVVPFLDLDLVDHRVSLSPPNKAARAIAHLLLLFLHVAKRKEQHPRERRRTLCEGILLQLGVALKATKTSDYGIPYLPSPALRKAYQGPPCVVLLACKAFFTWFRRVIAFLPRSTLGASSNPRIATFIGPLTFHHAVCYFDSGERISQ